jgi:hypothetical protein
MSPDLSFFHHLLRYHVLKQMNKTTLHLNIQRHLLFVTAHLNISVMANVFSKVIAS